MSRTNDGREVETLQQDGAWVVRWEAAVVARNASRTTAIETGADLAATLGVPHVVRYASARQLVPA
ncbi:MULTISPECIES: hypothetical protein [unclassified Nocardioides]|uniref:hypothetical protein n=1 Tax=unclassified Nocardioides TaxID=2615069 RepID=UPI0030150720